MLTALAISAGYHVHQFSNLSPLFGTIARDDGVLNAISDMVAQDFLFGAAKRRTHCRANRHP